MNVLYICHHIEIGGATKCFLEMLDGLPNKGVTPYVITPINNGTIMNHCETKNIACYYFDYNDLIFGVPKNKLKKIIKYTLYPLLLLKRKCHNIFLLNKVKQEISMEDIDLIHSNVNREDFGIMIAKKFNKKCIMHLREFGTNDFELKYFKHNIYKYYDKNVDQFIAISKVIQNFYINKGINPTKINQIYDGIDSKDIAVKDYDNYKLNDNFKIIMMGYICDSKGQIQIIETLHLMNENERKNIKVSFYGSGSDEYLLYLNSKIKEYNLIDNFEFFEYKNNIGQLIKNYDCGFTGSYSEAFGRVTVEYMMAHLPVIASDTGANLELISDKVDGLVYKYNNFKDLKEKILLLKNDYQFRKKLADQAYINSKKFLSNLNTNNIFDLYENMVNDIHSNVRGGNS